jgi:N6-L-threonylcarbamoyladenine synthase
VLAIETSCDETAAAVVDDGRLVLSSIVSSQVDMHARFGGVVPEVAGRAHVELLTPVVDEAMDVAGAAKAYSLAWGVPFVGVNHMEGHLHAAFLEDPDLALPAVVLLVSGGHTMLIHMVGPGRYRLLGQTIDDAAGEAFDKVARFLGLGYPGGPAIDHLSPEGDPHAIDFPRGLRGEGYDFSFSGVKTSVINYVRKHPGVATTDVAASFQEAVVDVLVAKTRKAADDLSARSLCIGGGVAANRALRDRIVEAAEADGRAAFVPRRAMCTDNAAMVGATGWYRLQIDGPTPLDAAVNPSLRLPLEN